MGTTADDEHTPEDGDGPRGAVPAATAGRTPRVSIGLPVYNGERYLSEALDSILGQTFGDFELIIADNASTDCTGEIARSYARRDPRIRYVRSRVNLGATKNFNRVFALASAPYFKWVAVDDLCAPTYLARCVELLDRTPDAVLAYTGARWIDERGDPLQIDERVPQHTDWPSEPAERFLRLVDDFVTDRGVSGPIYLYGVMRSEALRRTGLLRNFIGDDCSMLSELILLGRFVGVPDRLLSIRCHRGAASWTPNLTTVQLVHFLDPRIEGRLGRLVPRWRRYVQYPVTVVRSDLGALQKAALLLRLARPGLKHLRTLVAERMERRR